MPARRWMKGWILGLWVVCLGAMAVPAQPEADTPGRAQKGESRTLRVVTDNNYPPYVSLSADGQPEGYVVDL